MGRMRTVAWREFTTTVRRPTYILATLAMPLFLLTVTFIAAIPAMVAVRHASTAQRRVAVADEAGLFTPAALAQIAQLDEAAARASAAKPPESETGRDTRLDDLLTRMAEGGAPLAPSALVPYADRQAATADLVAGKIASFYVVPKDYLATGHIEYLSRRRQTLLDPIGAGSPVRSWLIAGVLAGKVSDAELARARRPIADVSIQAIGPHGGFVPQRASDDVARIVVPFAFAFILMLSIFIASSYLIQGLVEEKSNRVIELLLSSVTPDDLIGGKLLGLGGAGLLQLAVWVAFATVPMALLGGVPVSTAVVLLSVPFYITGFLFFGSIMAGVGCVAGTGHESQQFASLWAVTAVIPVFFSALILEAPNSLLSRVLSYIPFTCPITMIMRCASGEYVWWDVPLSLLVLAGATVLALRVSARLFRVGLLMTGQRPSLGELLAALRS